MKRFFALMLALAMVLSLAACGGNAPAADAPAADAPAADAPAAPAAPKEINIAKAYDATTLDPHQGNDDGSYNIIKYLSEGLVRNKGGVLVPGVAETWEMNEDGTEVVFHLRDNAVWSDGTAITAEDFHYSFLRLLDPSVGYNYCDSGFIFKNGEAYFNGEATAEEVGVEVIDSKTLKITRENPSIETLYQLAGTPFLPVRKDVAEAHGVSYGAEADKIMTNGAFTLTEWGHEAKLVLVKNDNYWDKDSIKLDKMTFVVGASGDTARELLSRWEVVNWICWRTVWTPRVSP